MLRNPHRALGSVEQSENHTLTMLLLNGVHESTWQGPVAQSPYGKCKVTEMVTLQSWEAQSPGWFSHSQIGQNMFLSLPLKILLIKDDPFTQLPKRRKEKRKHDSSTLQMGWLPERRLLEKGPGTRNFPKEKLRPRLSTHTPPQGPHDGLT